MNIHATPPNRFYPQQEPQRSLTEKGEGRRYKETCTLPPTPLLPPYPQTGGYCRCLKPSHLSKPSLPWLGTAQHPPGEVPNPQASSKFIHSTRVARAYHSTWQDFIPAPSEDIKGFSNSTQEMSLAHPLLMQHFWPFISESQKQQHPALSQLHHP